jgi:hypothetical protein
MKHLGPLALFGALAIAWTWPLALHLHDAVPGDPGDNYSFLWNLWWMRHVIATPGLAYFHTRYLFHPFGTTIANHPHTALPAIVAATLLGRASIVTAQNLLLLAYVFANMAAMYALVWDIGRERRTAILSAVIFGLSPYLAAHLLGHFDLMAAFVLPLFAPGDLLATYVLEKLSPGVWGYYSLSDAREGVFGGRHEASYENRAVAIYRHMVGIPTDQEPPARR